MNADRILSIKRGIENMTRREQRLLKAFHRERYPELFYNNESECDLFWTIAILNWLEYGDQHMVAEFPRFEKKGKIMVLDQSRFDSDITITQDMGQGSFGAAKLATFENKLQVVLKFPHSGTDEHNILEEIEIMTALGRAKCAIPKFYGFFSNINYNNNRYPYVLMLEYIDGKNMYKIISDNKYSATDAIKWCSQIETSIKCMHKYGFIHRDVHPENVMVRTDNNNIVLVDFGLSCQYKNIKKNASFDCKNVYSTDSQRTFNTLNMSDIIVEKKGSRESLTINDIIDNDMYGVGVICLYLALNMFLRNQPISIDLITRKKTGTTTHTLSFNNVFDIIDGDKYNILQNKGQTYYNKYFSSSFAVALVYFIILLKMNDNGKQRELVEKAEQLISNGISKSKYNEYILAVSKEIRESGEKYKNLRMAVK